MSENSISAAPSAEAAVAAIRRGFQPVPVRDGTKRPLNAAWTHERHDQGGDFDAIRARFNGFAAAGAGSLGLLLGEPSGGLIDVDIDHPRASRLKDHFLPATGMRSGRASRPSSHYWYLAEGTVPGTRRYQMPDRAVSVELRSSGSQTVIPPSVHPSGEHYRWEGPGRAWGEPARVSGRALAVQVALLALGSVLIDRWPRQGGRHDAYLALAGGLLRYGDDVHPWWERNIGVLIRALAMATNDEDGPDQRESESVRTTVARLRGTGPSGAGKVAGWPKLGEIIGQEHAETARRLAQEVESLSGFQRGAASGIVSDAAPDGPESDAGDSTEVLAPEDPYEARGGLSWRPFALDDFLSGKRRVEPPVILRREDGTGLMYPGRVNSLFGRSESAKSWIALMACLQEINAGERVVYVDFEDGPETTIDRLKQLGAGDDDIRTGFTYISPEHPLAAMQVNRWGTHSPTDLGARNEAAFWETVNRVDPRLIVADGMTVLYGLHGLDTNDSSGTDIITGWLKSLTRQRHTTVIIIDHTGKGAPRGSTPIGSQHKIAMVQGTALQVHPIDPPRKGKTGTLELIVMKDRPGEVRAVATQEEIQVAALVEMDSTVPGVTRTRIMVPPSGEVAADLSGDGKVQQVTQDRQLRDDILTVVERAGADGLSEAAIGAEVRALGQRSGHDRLHDAVAGLLKDKYIVHNGKGGRSSGYVLCWP